MDCFFAAVEMRDNPKLRNIPMAIGGLPGRGGILCTANYPARKFGVRAALPSFKAIELCPNLLILPPRSHAYKEASEQIREIFSKYTPIIEPLGLDEAYLDVTDSEKCSNSATLIALEIRKEIYKNLKLTASAGISTSKFLAKIASDWRKPNGQYTIPPESVFNFLTTLDVSLLPGVGKVLTKKLKSAGIRNCQDIREQDHTIFKTKFGKKTADYLHKLSLGLDNRDVNPNRDRKSVGIERTLVNDLASPLQCQQELEKMINKFEQRLKNSFIKYPNKTPQKLFVKVKTFEFNSHTVEQTIDSSYFKSLLKSGKLSNDLILLYEKLISEAYLVENQPVRLIGMGIKLKEKEQFEQLRLFA